MTTATTTYHSNPRTHSSAKHVNPWAGITGTLAEWKACTMLLKRIQIPRIRHSKPGLDHLCTALLLEQRWVSVRSALPIAGELVATTFVHGLLTSLQACRPSGFSGTPLDHWKLAKL